MTMKTKTPGELLAERHGVPDAALDAVRRRAILAAASPRQWIWWRNAAGEIAATGRRRGPWAALAAAWLAIVVLFWAANGHSRPPGGTQSAPTAEWRELAAVKAQLALLDNDRTTEKKDHAHEF